MVTKKKPDDEGDDKKAAAKTPAKKAAAPKAKKAAKKKDDVAGVQKAEAEVRATQEEGSIAPPSSNLVSAFALFGKTKKRPQVTTPTVTRLAAGSSLPKPPAPKPATPPAPAPSAQTPAPAPVAGAPVAPPKPAAPTISPTGPKPATAVPGAPGAPVARPAVPGAPGAVPPRPAVPGTPGAPVARPAVPGAPVARPAVPGAPVARPGVPGAPGSVPPRPAVPGSVPPRPGVPGAPGAPVARPGMPGSVPPRPGQVPPRPGQYPQRPGGPGGMRPGQPPQRPGAGRPGSTGHRPAPKPTPAPVAKVIDKNALKPLEVSSMVTVRELAEKMEVKPNDVIKKLMGLGIFATINQRLEQEAAGIIANDYGWELKLVAMEQEAELQQSTTAVKEAPEKLKPRPPVVTIMGHVDHGKTSLLDAIRSARVAEGESGGITQHIGAYQVKTPKGLITFLDTPGHEAFTAMRARGAKATDIVVLVVSATDGVMPQTLEAIDHAKAAAVPIIVAVNKIDLPGADPQKIRTSLATHGLQPEEWGGKTIFQDVSAKKKVNLDKLLEVIQLQSEIGELKANPDRPGFGVILEAKMDAKRGSVATLLVQGGTVKVGDAFVAGLCYGKIKALVDDTGSRVPQAGPSTPVEILGLIGTPQAGDVFSVVSDDRQSRDIAEKRQLLNREQQLAHQRHMTLVGLKASLGGAAAKDLNIVLKADMQGSMQALKDSLEGLSNAECKVRIIHSGIGGASESDVLLASASDAVIMLFHSAIDSRAEEVAAREGVEVRKYEIIYDLIGDVKASLEGLLAPEIVDVIVGKGEIKQVFAVKNGAIAGSMIREGKVVRGGLAKIMRGSAVVFEGKISGLKRFKDDVKEVEKGLECGISFEGNPKFAVGDQLEFIVKESRTRRLSQAQQS